MGGNEKVQAEGWRKEHRWKSLLERFSRGAVALAGEGRRSALFSGASIVRKCICRKSLGDASIRALGMNESQENHGDTSHAYAMETNQV
jgi:hypothetical protein